MVGECPNDFVSNTDPWPLSVYHTIAVEGIVGCNVCCLWVVSASKTRVKCLWDWAGGFYIVVCTLVFYEGNNSKL